MSDFTWKEWLPIISLGISLLALFVNFSKFMTDMVDRKERKKKEKTEADKKLKAYFTCDVNGNTVTIKNDSDVDAVIIKEIFFDGTKWKESGLLTDACPSQFGRKQEKRYRLSASKDNPFPSIITIHYSDLYTRKYGLGAESQDIHL